MMLHVLKPADWAIWMLVVTPLLVVSVANAYHMPSYSTMHGSGKFEVMTGPSSYTGSEEEG